MFRREVSYTEGAAFAQKYNIKFFETSAKTAQNVEEAFLSTAGMILENIEKNEYDLTNDVGINLSNIIEHWNKTRKCVAHAWSCRSRKKAKISFGKRRHQTDLEGYIIVN